jgi:hypothetical protein
MISTHSLPKGKGKEKHIRALSKRAKKTALFNKKGVTYEFVNSTKNPEYEKGLKPLPFESSLIHNKGHRIYVKTKPKYLTNLAEFKTDEEGLPILTREIETNDLKSANYRKIKAVDKWCNYWHPLYNQKKITLFFFTLTRLNYARISIRQLLKILKLNLSRNNIQLLDYLWILEISEGLHCHYHLVVAIDRKTFKKIPEFLKLEKYWGQRTEIDFVKKNIRFYLSKYFGKNSWRIDSGMRAYGQMRKPIRK